jgi:DNA (cytosine-5)-methyltransferase 1
MTLIPTLDLFSGIGGFSLALRGATRTVAYCDISPKSRAVLAAQAASRALDRAPILDDVTTLTAASLRTAGVRERVRLITGGFPCQDISAMNPNGDGIRGTRSGLISEIFRLQSTQVMNGTVDRRSINF